MSPNYEIPLLVREDEVITKVSYDFRAGNSYAQSGKIGANRAPAACR